MPVQGVHPNHKIYEGILKFSEGAVRKMAGKAKIDVSIDLAYRLLHPRNTILVTCIGNDGKPNIITLAWSMPVSLNPPIVAISIAPKRYSHKLIEETKEFVINIPTIEILKETLYCGRVSGRNVDKFKETSLTPAPAKKVKAPIIKECITHLECIVERQITAGDHTLFLGKVVAAYTNEGVFDETFDVRKAKLVYHLGGDAFATLRDEVIVPS